MNVHPSTHDTVKPQNPKVTSDTGSKNMPLFFIMSECMPVYVTFPLNNFVACEFRRFHSSVVVNSDVWYVTLLVPDVSKEGTKTTRSFQKSETTYRATQRHISEDGNAERRAVTGFSCDSLCDHWKLPYVRTFFSTLPCIKPTRWAAELLNSERQ